MALSKASFSNLRIAFSGSWRENLGADIFQQYIRLRMRLLKAERLQTSGDKPIEYVKIEQGKKNKMIFLPGFADTKENFFDAAQFLANDFDMIIPDLPGFGRSFKNPEDRYTLKHYGQWLEGFIREVGWQDIHLVGNSLGGAIAIELSLRMPEIIKSLTLIDPAGVALPEHTSVYKEFIQGRNVFEIQSRERFEYFLHRVFHKPPVIPVFVKDHLYSEMAKNSKWHRKILYDLLENVADFDDPRILEVSLNNKLKEIKIPTLIIWGDEDSFFPSETGFFMQQQIEGSKLYILHDRGHIPQIEAPLQFARLFRKFVRTLRKNG